MQPDLARMSEAALAAHIAARYGDGATITREGVVWILTVDGREFSGFHPSTCCSEADWYARRRNGVAR